MKTFFYILFFALLSSSSSAWADAPQPIKSHVSSSIKSTVESKDSAFAKGQNNQQINSNNKVDNKSQQSSNSNYTLIAAMIAAAASLTSAIITLLSKDKDFSNDYYKRIIERRFNIYKDVERILYDLRNIRLSDDKKSKCMHVFFDKANLDKVIEKIDAVLLEGFWLSKNERNALGKLYYLLFTTRKDIRNEIKKLHESDDYIPEEYIAINEKNIYVDFGVKTFKEIQSSAVMVSLYLRKDLAQIHKVKSYLKALIRESEDFIKKMEQGDKDSEKEH